LAHITDATEDTKLEQTVTTPKTAVSWFAIPAANFKRAVRFYETIMETQLHVGDFGSEEIAVFEHADADGVGGCVTTGTPSTDGVLIYLCADGRLDRTLELTVRAGGRVDVPKYEIPNGLGFSAHIIDSEGNRVGLHAKA
jgi:predicted enzyme related to lactoylglutathione lyase